MTGELQIDAPGLTGETLYALLFNSGGQIYDAIGANFEDIVDAQWGNYDIALTEQGTASGNFRADMPAVAAGAYSFVVRRQAGGAPAVTDTAVGACSCFQWDGSAELPLSTIKGYVDDLETRLTAVRAGYLDNLSAGAAALASVCTEARLAELDAANIPADADTLKTRLTAARAGYLDNLSAGAVALEATLTAIKGAGWTDETLKALSDQIDVIVPTGAYQITLQLYETGTTTPIADVAVSVKNSDQSLLLGVVETDSLGQTVFGRNDGTYKLLCEKSGYTFTTPETLTVAGVAVSQTIYGTPWVAPTSPSIYTCTVYGWVKDIDNTALSSKAVSARIAHKPVYYSGVGYSAIQSASDTTDGNGYFELTLTRSRYMTTTTGDPGRYTFTIAESGIVWTIEVPDASSAAFSDCKI